MGGERPGPGGVGCAAGRGAARGPMAAARVWGPGAGGGRSGERGGERGRDRAGAAGPRGDSAVPEPRSSRPARRTQRGCGAPATSGPGARRGARSKGALWRTPAPQPRPRARPGPTPLPPPPPQRSPPLSLRPPPPLSWLSPLPSPRPHPYSQTLVEVAIPRSAGPGHREPAGSANHLCAVVGYWARDPKGLQGVDGLKSLPHSVARFCLQPSPRKDL